MSKLSLNLTKIGKKIRQNYWLKVFLLWWRKMDWWVGHGKKRINSNNIHLRVSFPQNVRHPPRSASQPSSSCCGRNSSPFSAVWGHGRIGSCLPTPPHLLGGLDPHTLASEEGKKLQIALKIKFKIANKHLKYCNKWN